MGKSIKRNASLILAEAAKTFAERHAVYGDNYLNVGGALQALFPDGIEVFTTDDHNRFHIFMLVLVKLSRYANNWKKGGHQDSIRDAAVYAAMLESIDEDIADIRAHAALRNNDIKAAVRKVKKVRQKLAKKKRSKRA